MEELTKEEWRKILTDSNIAYREALAVAAIQKSTADLAREHLKILNDDRKNKKLPSAAGKSDEVQSDKESTGLAS